MSDALKEKLAGSTVVRFAPTTSRGLRSADIRPSTFNDEDWSVELTIASSVEVQRSYWDYRRDREVEFVEILPVAGAVLPDRSGRAVPILDSHSSWSTRSVIGRLVECWVDGDQIVGRCVLSRRESVKDIIEGIREGVISNVSAGYSIDKVSVTEVEGRTIATADEWTLLEVSFVPVPADGSSQTRSIDLVREHAAQKRSIEPTGKSDMTKEEITTLVADGVRAALAAEKTAAEKAAADAAAAGAGGERAQTPPAKTGKRSAEEQALVDTLRAQARSFGVEETFSAFEASGADTAELRGIVLNGMRSHSSPREIDGGLSGSTGKRAASISDLRWEDCAAFRGATGK